ncbi:MAG: hypothetical protein LBG94_07660 [Treponema sp.]|jgi:hypothetical protein|nr:hypothetical protein [Treponema sp.]
MIKNFLPVHKRKPLIITIVIFILIITAIILFFTIPRKSPNIVIDSSGVIPYLKDGDIILRHGDGALSSPFSEISLTDKRFSHLGIVRIRNGNISVINAVGSILNKEKGVEENSLEQFLQAALNIGVFRVKSIDGTLISDKALEYLNRPFDWGFNLFDDSKIYCSELLYVVIKSIAPDMELAVLYIDTINMNVFPLDSVSASDYFDEILYIELLKKL